MLDIGKVKIVIVDDEEVIHQQLLSILNKFDSEVVCFTDSQHALDYLGHQSDIDILITELIMPGMDGCDFIRKVKAIPEQEFIYVMLLTGFRDTDSFVSGIHSGADDFLDKPIVDEEIVAKIYAGMRVQRLRYELQENNERLSSTLSSIKKDLKAAATLSMTVLPQEAPKVSSVELQALFKPCEYVGGDLYGFKSITRDSLAFFQIDVAGHGIPSALFSFSLGHELTQEELFSSAIVDFDSNQLKPQVNNVDRAVTAINQSSVARDSDMYFTMVYGVLNTETGLVKFCQAGHPPLIHYCTETKKATTHGVGGFPVGIMIDAVFEEQRIQMKPNDRLFIYSDGIPEAENCSGQFFGEEQLCRVIEEGKDKSINELLEAIYYHVTLWCGDERPGDDLTIIGLQWNGVGRL